MEVNNICPFCGAEADPEQQGWEAFYLCKTGLDTDGEFYRGVRCYEAQLAECAEVVRHILAIPRVDTISWYAPNIKVQAAALLPRLEKATEGK